MPARTSRRGASLGRHPRPAPQATGERRRGALMNASNQSYRVAVIWRGDAQARAEASAETSRLKAIFAALAEHGIAAEPCVWDDDLSEEVRAQLAAVDGA